MAKIYWMTEALLRPAVHTRNVVVTRAPWYHDRRNSSRTSTLGHTLLNITVKGPNDGGELYTLLNCISNTQQLAISGGPQPRLILFH